jgi:hypothetical protein
MPGDKQQMKDSLSLRTYLGHIFLGLTKDPKRATESDFIVEVDNQVVRVI